MCLELHILGSDNAKLWVLDTNQPTTVEGMPWQTIGVDF